MNCCSLPPLGRLASLKHLEIERLESVKTVGAEFYGIDPAEETKRWIPFPSLETLSIEWMLGWSEWTSCDDFYAFPLLRKLSMKGCYELRASLPSDLPCLEVLDVNRCGELYKLPRSNKIPIVKIEPGVYEYVRVYESPSCPGLYDLEARGIGYLESLVKLLEPTGCVLVTQSIEMEDFSGIKCFQLEQFPRLESLKIKGCDNLESLAEIRPHSSLSPAPTLTDLNIKECASLKSLPPLPSLVELDIFDCSAFESFGEPLPANLQNLKVSYCPKLDSFGGPLPANLQVLEVSNCPELDSFGGSLPANLQKLEVFNHPKLDSFGGPLPANLQVSRSQQRV
ncbi:hypothetical protein Tsubulata_049104 [Turnera subulata]|uniref:Uncharacterized protein n=1 Tax=Turnera subulata TaxID=218843 RepID=A0A9Q0J9B3_9ROSI|nr:hypothetical protein Tsubulata_049104 [Turnera subulata]